ncbi:MAG: SprB repeat-containing protein, partial [Bacteroidetes bacterium]|nr:SprB repeat-containing protein [Bacteroidota bacterium]
MKNSMTTRGSLPRMLICLLLISAFRNAATAQCPAATSLVINSVSTSQSRCAASGKATVSASGGRKPYIYSIIAGPVLAPPQSSNVLQSLEPGSYTVKVTDNCNTSVTRNFTITGNYAVPAPTVISQPPSCSGSSDGSITINVTDGRAPFSYSLISPSPVIAGPKAGNVFTGLPAGTYTCQVSDSCGNFQTRTVSLVVTPGTVGIGGPTLQYLACDSFAVYIPFPVSNYNPPYTIKATLPNGTVKTHVLTAPAINSGVIMDTFYVRFHHVAGAADMMPVTITDKCGVSSSASLELSTGMDMSVTSALPSDCSSNYTYTFDASPSLHCGTVTYKLVNPSGAVVATQINNATFTGYPPGTGYKVIRQDCCRKDTLQFDWAAAPPFAISWLQNMTYGSCKEGLISLYIAFNYSSRLADLVLVSGPPSVTFADGTVHTYTYPDTSRNVGSGAVLGYFGPGTYKFYVIDQCGNKDSATVSFAPSDMRSTVFTASVIKGCTDANKILLNVNSNSSYSVGQLTVDPVYSRYTSWGDNIFTDSIVNLPAGTYYATYEYQLQYGINWVGMTDPGCDVIRDTLIVPVYTQPSFNSSAAVAVCGAARNVALLPDSSSGVFPYAYQIIGGPATTSQQASPVFPGLSTGTYTFLMADGCGNSYSHSISIDTLSVPGVVASGSTCAGAAVTFILPSIPFYSYTWQLPHGGTSTGNSLSINPVRVSDTGSYKITVTSSIGGCTDTESKNYTLSYCMLLAEGLLRFDGRRKGGNLELEWQTADEINISSYIVERSTDGISFATLQQAGATYIPMHVYTVTDRQVPSGVVFYRLKMVLKNGTHSYSNILSFNNTNMGTVNVYPRLITGNTAL